MHGLAVLFGLLQLLDLFSWSPSHKFVWCTDYRAFVSKVLDYSDNIRTRPWIVDVMVIPGQQELDTVYGSNSDM